MKTNNAPIDERRTDDNGLVAKHKTLQKKPAWIKTRRFFWAVGVVLWEDVILRLIFPRETYLAERTASELEKRIRANKQES